MDRSLRPILAALFLGGCGASGAAILGAPAPFLTGPALVVALAGCLGATVHVPALLRQGCFIVVGLGLGAAVTPDTLAAAAAWPISLVAMAASLVAIVAAGAAFLRRIHGRDRVTAVLSAAPGHLSFVIGLSLDTRADARFVTVVQSLRVLMLTLLVPAIVTAAGHGGGSGTDGMTAVPGIGQPAMAPVHLVGLGLCAVLLGWAFTRFRVPAAFLIAAMVVSTAGHAGGLTPGTVPAPLGIAAFAVMGTLIGTRFSGVVWTDLRRAAGAALALTAGSVAIVAAASLAVVALTDLPLADVVIALAPGGLETMVAMSALVGADPAFVALHHVARLFLLSVLIPVAVTRAGRHHLP